MNRAKQIAPWLGILLSISGVIVCAALLRSHFTQSQSTLCSIVGPGDCSEVLRSRWAVFPPADSLDQATADIASGPLATERSTIPVAMIGLWYFTALTIWQIFVGRPTPDRRFWHLVPLIATFTGVAASLVFIVVMKTYIGQWCSMCLTVHAINFLLAGTIVLGWPSKSRASSSHGVTSESEHLQRASRHTPTTRQAFSAVLCSVAVCVAVWQATSRAQLRQKYDLLAEQTASVLADADVSGWLYAKQDPTTVALDGADTAIPATSTADSKLDLVLFTDLECSYCQKFEDRLLNEIAPLFGGHLEIAFRHFPLCTDCNLSIERNTHPAACEAAYLAEAARLQGGIGAFLEIKALLATSKGPWDASEVARFADVLGIDADQLERDRHSESVQRTIARDIELAESLEIRGTPTVFLEGRKVEGSARDQLGFWKLLAAKLTPSTTQSALQLARRNAAVDVEEMPPHSATVATDREQRLADQERHERLAEVLMKRYDKNDDGKLTEDEWPTNRRGLENADANGDKIVTMEELVAKFTTASQLVTPSRIQEITSALRNGDGLTRPRFAIELGQELEIKGPAMNGGEFNLQADGGEATLVMFWSARCGPCRSEMPNIKRIYDQFHSRGLEVVGVNLDPSTDEAQQFVNEHELPWPQIRFPVQDEPKSASPLASKYQIRAIPAIFLVDAEGKVVERNPRGEQLIRRIEMLFGTIQK